MNIVNENITRKVDSLGLVSIPSGLRSRYGYNAGDEINFSTLYNAGQDYILMSKDNGIDPKYEITYETLNELGCEIPLALASVVNDQTHLNLGD